MSEQPSPMDIMLIQNSIASLNESNTDATENQEKTTVKTKRKSNEEKIYVCTYCDKKYFSIASLNAHIRFKHRLQEANNKSKIRGRPKKMISPPASETSSAIAVQNEREDFKEPNLVEQDDNKGTTQDYITVFDEVLEALYQKSSHPLRIAMEKINHKETIIEKTCDVILGEYLIEMSRMVKKEFYRMVATFVLLYRDCFNSVYKERSEREGADRLPWRCNEFMEKFGEKSKLPSGTLIKLTMHMCKWLLEHSYTWVKLTLIE